MNFGSHTNPSHTLLDRIRQGSVRKKCGSIVKENFTLPNRLLDHIGQESVWKQVWKHQVEDNLTLPNRLLDHIGQESVWKQVWKHCKNESHSSTQVT